MIARVSGSDHGDAGSSAAANTTTGKCHRYSEYDALPTTTATGFVLRNSARGGAVTPPASASAVASVGAAAHGPESPPQPGR